MPRLEALKKRYQEVSSGVAGQECEVYSRIVGYYRSVKNWNKGKAQEFTERVTFTV